MSDPFDDRIREAVARIAATRPAVDALPDPSWIRLAGSRHRPRLVPVLAGFVLMLAAAGAGFLVARLESRPAAAPEPVAATVLSGSAVLHADLYRAGERGVVLGTGYGWDAADLAPIARLLAGADVTVLVVDVRGVGGSAGPADVLAMPDDLVAAVDHLRDVVSGPVWLMGFSHSATGAVVAAADPRLAAVGVAAMLPFTSYQGLDAEAAAPGSLVPLHIVGLSQDRMFSSAAWALDIYRAAPEPKSIEILPRIPTDTDLITTYGPSFADSMLILIAGS